LPVLDPQSAPKFNLPVAVDLEYSCYSLDQAEAHEILVPLPNLATAWEKVHALAADKKAKLEFITSFRTKSGQRALAEEIHEVRMATEYNPSYTATKDSSGSFRVIFAGQENDSTPRSQIFPGFPTKIESRNAGITADGYALNPPMGFPMEQDRWVTEPIRTVAHRPIAGRGGLERMIIDRNVIYPRFQICFARHDSRSARRSARIRTRRSRAKCTLARSLITGCASAGFPFSGAAESPSGNHDTVL